MVTQSRAAGEAWQSAGVQCPQACSEPHWGGGWWDGDLDFFLPVTGGLSHRVTCVALRGTKRLLLPPLVPSTNPLGGLTAIFI